MLNCQHHGTKAATPATKSHSTNAVVVITWIYLISHPLKIWHKTVLWRGQRLNQDSCTAGRNILEQISIFDPVSFLILEKLNTEQY